MEEKFLIRSKSSFSSTSSTLIPGSTIEVVDTDVMGGFTLKSRVVDVSGVSIDELEAARGIVESFDGSQDLNDALSYFNLLLVSISRESLLDCINLNESLCKTIVDVVSSKALILGSLEGYSEDILGALENIFSIASTFYTSVVEFASVDEASASDGLSNIVLLGKQITTLCKNLNCADDISMDIIKSVDLLMSLYENSSALDPIPRRRQLQSSDTDVLITKISDLNQIVGNLSELLYDHIMIGSSLTFELRYYSYIAEKGWPVVAEYSLLRGYTVLDPWIRNVGGNAYGTSTLVVKNQPLNTLTCALPGLYCIEVSFATVSLFHVSAPSSNINHEDSYNLGFWVENKLNASKKETAHVASNETRYCFGEDTFEVTCSPEVTHGYSFLRNESCPGAPDDESMIAVQCPVYDIKPSCAIDGVERPGCTMLQVSLDGSVCFCSTTYTEIDSTIFESISGYTTYFSSSNILSLYSTQMSTDYSMHILNEESDSLILKQSSLLLSESSLVYLIPLQIICCCMCLLIFCFIWRRRFGKAESTESSVSIDDYDFGIGEETLDDYDDFSEDDSMSGSEFDSFFSENALETSIEFDDNLQYGLSDRKEESLHTKPSVVSRSFSSGSTLEAGLIPSHNIEEPEYLLSTVPNETSFSSGDRPCERNDTSEQVLSDLYGNDIKCPTSCGMDDNLLADEFEIARYEGNSLGSASLGSTSFASARYLKKKEKRKAQKIGFISSPNELFTLGEVVNLESVNSESVGSKQIAEDGFNFDDVYRGSEGSSSVNPVFTGLDDDVSIGSTKSAGSMHSRKSRMSVLSDIFSGSRDNLKNLEQTDEISVNSGSAKSGRSGSSKHGKDGQLITDQVAFGYHENPVFDDSASFGSSGSKKSRRRKSKRALSPILSPRLDPTVNESTGDGLY